MYESAFDILYGSINEYAAENEGDIKLFDNGPNVTCGSDYELFIIDKIPLSD